MSVLRRPQKVLVAAVQTDAVHFWGSKITTYGASGDAAVVMNRQSRASQRLGSVDRHGTNDESEGHRGFGPAPPIVVGAKIAFRGPKVVRTRSRRLSDWQRQGTSTLHPPIVVNPAVSADVARPTAVHLAYSRRGEAKSSLPGPLVVASPTPPFDPIRTHLAPSSRGKAKSRLQPPTVVSADSYTPCAFVTDNFTRANEDPIGGIWKNFPGGSNPAKLQSNQYAAGATTSGDSVLRQTINPNAPWQISATIGTYDAANGVLVIKFVRSDGLTFVSCTAEASSSSVILSGFGFGIATTIRKIGAGDQFALTCVPGSPNTYRVLHRPFGASAFQTILQTTDTNVYSAETLPFEPGLQVDNLLTVSSFSVCPYTNDGVTPMRATQRRGIPKSHLSPPIIPPVATFVARPALVHLTRITPVATHSFLRKPVVTLTPATRPSARIAGQLAPPLDTVPATQSFLRPAIIPPVFVQTFSGPTVTLAPPSRRKVVYDLALPVVVIPAVVVAVPSGPLVTLAPSKRGKAKSFLRAPVVVRGAVLQRPALVHLAYSRRGTPKSRLRPPVVVAPVLARRLVTKLVRIRPPATKSHLSPPAVVTPVQTAVFFGPQVHLVKTRPVKTLAILHAPAVISGSITYGGPRVRLTNPLDRVPATMSRLRPPTVTVSAQTFTGPQTTLAPSKRGTPKSILHPPTDTKGLEDQGRVAVHLAYSRRGRPLSILREPVVVAPVLARPIRVELARIRPVKTLALLHAPTVVTPRVPQDATLDVTLAYSVRGKAKSRLRPPAVVAPVLARPALVHLVRIRPVATRWRLGKPVDLVDQQDVGSLRTHLAYSLRGKPKSRLAPPAVVAPVLARAILVHLAPSSRGVPKSRLAEPTVVTPFTPFVARPTAVHLSYSLRGKPKSTLRRPVVVAPVLARPITTTLAPQKRGTPKSRLEPPTVVFPFFARPTSITLARIRPVPTRWLLGKPTDLVDQQDIGVLRVHLAYSRRGVPKSLLSPPAVVAPVLARPIVTKLARIRPVATRWELKPPTVVRLAVELSGPEVTLVRIRPPRTIARLRPPVAGAAQLKAERTLSVTLAPQRRGKAKPRLGKPVVVTAATPYFRREPVTLAPQRRGEAKPFLRPPTVLRAFVARPIEVTLAPQRRGTPKSLLNPPTVVTARGITDRIGVSLARIRPVPVRSILRRPTVIDLRPQTFFLSLTLTRIRPAKTRWLLREPVVVTNECYGDVVGFDFAPEVCGSDESATVTGTTSSTDAVSGSDSAATVQGASAAGGSVTGGDEKREGC